MKHIVYEPENVYDFLQNPNVNIDDTIEYFTNNQLGYKEYKVIEKNGKKDIEEIGDIYSKYYGGIIRKRKSYKRKSHKRKR